MDSYEGAYYQALSYLYDLCDLFQSCLEDFKGKDLTDFQRGQKLTYKLAIESTQTRIELLEETFSEEDS